jgi:hypothetical protein
MSEYKIWILKLINNYLSPLREITEIHIPIRDFINFPFA